MSLPWNSLDGVGPPACRGAGFIQGLRALACLRDAAPRRGGEPAEGLKVESHSYSLAFFPGFPPPISVVEDQLVLGLGFFCGGVSGFWPGLGGSVVFYQGRAETSMLVVDDQIAIVVCCQTILLSIIVVEDQAGTVGGGTGLLLVVFCQVTVGLGLLCLDLLVRAN